jgi:hypothetical protein
LPIVLYRCEISPPILRAEYRLKIFTNRVLKTISEPMRVETIGGWKKLHDMELHKLYSLPDILRMIKSNRMR